MANVISILKQFKDINVNKDLRLDFICDIIENFFCSMFDFKNYPDSLPKEYAIKYLIWSGAVAAGKIPDEYSKGFYKGNIVFMGAQTAEDPDAYGNGSKCIVSTANGFVKTVDFEDIAFTYLNSAHSSLRSFIVACADDIANALISLRQDVKYTRNHPIYKSKDDAEAAVLNKFWDDIDAGSDALAVTSKNIYDDALEDLNGQKNASNNIINLTDPINSDKMQYVTKVVDDYMRWALGLFGQAIQGNGKMAQQTVDEVNGQTSSSFILPNDMLEHLQKFNERMKELSFVPDDAEIDFSKAWKVEEIKYEKEADAEAVEEADTEAEEEADTEADAQADTKEDAEE